MRRILFAVIAAIVAAEPARAEPGPVVNWLMETPTSRFDFGMERLRSHFYGFKGTHPLAPFFKSAYYDWDENRIWIAIYTNTPYVAEQCAEHLNEVREAGGVSEGKFKYPGPSSYYSQAFSSEFRLNSEPKQYLAKIDEIVRVQTLMVGGSCQGKLLSSEVLHKTE